MRKVWRYKTGHYTLLTTDSIGWTWEDGEKGKWNSVEEYEAWIYREVNGDQYEFLYDLSFEYYAKSLDKAKGQ